MASNADDPVHEEQLKRVSGVVVQFKRRRAEQLHPPRADMVLPFGIGCAPLPVSPERSCVSRPDWDRDTACWYKSKCDLLDHINTELSRHEEGWGEMISVLFEEALEFASYKNEVMVFARWPGKSARAAS